MILKGLKYFEFLKWSMESAMESAMEDPKT
jgi:hypothetical protein